MLEILVNVVVSLAVVGAAVPLLLRFLRGSGLALGGRGAPGDAPTGDAGSAVTAAETATVLAFALLWRLLLYGVALLCGRLMAGDEAMAPSLVRLFSQWDANHYINLVNKGYTGYIENGQHLFLVFFPLYVWITRLVNFFVQNTAASAMLVSTLCYAWGTLFMYKLAAGKYGRETARLAVLYLSVFPFSFFFGGIMTESLFFLTISASLYSIWRHRWLAAGLWGMLAAATRMLGLLLVVAAFIELVETYKPLEKAVSDRKERILSIVKRMPLVLLPCVGTLVYLALNYSVDGDPFAFVIQQQHWYQGSMWVSQVIWYLGANVVKTIHDSICVSIWLPEVVLFVLFFILFVVALRGRRHSTMLLAFGFTYFIMTYSLSWLLSAGRYLSCGFVFFLFLAEATKDRPKWKAGIAAVSSVLMGVYYFAFLMGMDIM